MAKTVKGQFHKKDIHNETCQCKKCRAQDNDIVRRRVKDVLRNKIYERYEEGEA